MPEDEGLTYEETLRQGGEAMLREASAYFAGAGRLHGALRRLAERLDATGIPYAVLRDLADVQDLIVRLNLPLSLADALDASVRGAYRDLWNKAQEGTV